MVKSGCNSHLRQLDIPGTAELITTFVKRTVTEAGLSRMVVAVSGGVDSAVSVALAASALGPEVVFALSLPYQTCARASDFVEVTRQPVPLPVSKVARGQDRIKGFPPTPAGWERFA